MSYSSKMLDPLQLIQEFFQSTQSTPLLSFLDVLKCFNERKASGTLFF